MKSDDIRQFIIQWEKDENKITGGKVNFEVYKKLVKCIFCPKRYNADKLTLEEVRKLSIKHPVKPEFEQPNRWMPPESVLSYLAMLYDYQIEYLMTAGKSDAQLPDFMVKGCLRTSEDREIEYNFGDEVYIENQKTLLSLDELELSEKISHKPRKTRRIKSEVSVASTTVTTGNKRQHEDTPQKGCRCKLGPKTSTQR